MPFDRLRVFDGMRGCNQDMGNTDGSGHGLRYVTRELVPPRRGKRSNSVLMSLWIRHGENAFNKI